MLAKSIGVKAATLALMTLALVACANSGQSRSPPSNGASEDTTHPPTSYMGY
jgi:hypothetical protein